MKKASNRQPLLAKTVSPDSKGLQQCADALLAGGTVLVPTDTVYGVAALAGNTAALDRLFAMKGRAAQSPVALLRPRDPGWAVLGVNPPDPVRELAKRFWPGALTLLMRSEVVWDARIDGGKGVLGVRVPALDWLLDLLENVQDPVGVTSANLSGAGEIHDPDDLPEPFLQALDLIVDSGPLPPCRPSTVIDATGDTARLVRLGALSMERLSTVIDTES